MTDIIFQICFPRSGQQLISTHRMSFEIIAEDGHCTLRLKEGEAAGLKFQNVWNKPPQFESKVKLDELSFNNWPVTVQHAIISCAWKQADNIQERHALRCSFKAARDYTSSLIRGADLVVSTPVFEEGAIRTLSCFPHKAVLTRISIKR